MCSWENLKTLIIFAVGLLNKSVHLNIILSYGGKSVTYPREWLSCIWYVSQFILSADDLCTPVRKQQSTFYNLPVVFKLHAMITKGVTFFVFFETHYNQLSLQRTVTTRNDVDLISIKRRQIDRKCGYFFR